MANVKGITVRIGADTGPLNDALKQVNSTIRATQTDLKEVEKLLKLDPTNTELLRQKQELLKDSIGATKEKLDALKQASDNAAKTAGNYDAWKAKYDPIKAQIDDTSKKLKELREASAECDKKIAEGAKAEQKYGKLQNEISKTETSLEKLKTQAQEADKQLAEGKISQEKYDALKEKVGQTEEKLRSLKEQSVETERVMNEGKLAKEKYDALQAEIKETETGLQTLKEKAKAVSDEFGNPISPDQYNALQREIIETEQNLRSLEEQAIRSNATLAKIGAAGDAMQKVGSSLQDVGKNLTTHVTAPIAAAGAAAVKITADFDESMSKVKAISGATGDSFDDLRNKAREMGAKTKFSASEAADAMTYMAMAGWKDKQMLEGIDGIMNLAAASGEDLATTSDIVTDALTAFGLKAEDANHLADVMAAASSNANTNVSMLGESFKYVAATAGAMGFTIEDTNLALGLMANAGIKGSQAGNSLKNAMVNLTKPTKQQAEAMKALGFISTETIQKIDFEKVEKAEEKVKIATNNLENAQINLNSAVEKYGKNSDQARKASNAVEKAEISLARANRDLEKQQAGVTKSIEKNNELMTNSDGSMKSLRQVMDVLRTSLSKTGVELVDAEGNAREFDDIINELSQSEEGLAKAQQLQYAATLFGKQNMAGMLAIINASEEDYNKLAAAIDTSTGAAEKMAETMQDNLNGQIEILKSALQELAISVGDILMPKIRAIVGKVQDFVGWLNSLDEGTKQVVVKIGLLAAAIGPVVLITGTLINKMGAALSGFKKLSEGLGVLRLDLKNGTGLVGKLGTALSGITAPVAVAIAAIGVLVAAFVHLWNNNEAFRKRMTDIWESIKRIISAFVANFKTELGNLIQAFQPALDVMKQAWDAFCQMLAPVFEFAFATIANILNLVTRVIVRIVRFLAQVFSGDFSGALATVGDLFKQVWDFICVTFKNAGAAIVGIANTILGWFGTDWPSVWDGLAGFMSGIWDKIAGFFTGAWNVIKGIWEGAGAFFSGIWNALHQDPTLAAVVDFVSAPFRTAWNAIKAVWDTVAGFFEGIWNTLRDATGLSGIGSAIEYVFLSAYNAVLGVWNGITGFFEDIWNAITSGEALRGIVEGISGFFTRAWDAIRGVWDLVVGFFSGIWRGITSDGGLTGITESISGFFTRAWDAIRGVWEAVTGFFSGIWKGITGEVSLQEIPGKVSGFFTRAWDAIRGVWDTVTGFFSGIWKGITGEVSLQEIPGKVSGFFSTAWNGVKTAWDTAAGFFQNLWTGITTNQSLKNIGTSISGFFSSGWTAVQKVWGGAKEFFTNTFNGIYKAAKSVWDKVSGWLGKLFGWGSSEDSSASNAQDKSAQAAGKVASGVSGAFSKIDKSISEPITSGVNAGIQSFDKLLKSGQTVAKGIITLFQSVGKSLKEISRDITTILKTISTNTGTVITSLSQKLKSLMTSIKSSMSGMISSLTSGFNSVRTSVVSGFASMKQSVVSLLSGMLTNIKSAMTNAYSLVRSAMEAIRNTTRFSWSLPYLKMPHISISGSWSMDPPRAPSFSVRWYRDAMRNGMILNSPTIFGMMNGKYLGAGEAGSEVVVGADSLMSMIRNVITGIAESGKFRQMMETSLRMALENMIEPVGGQGSSAGAAAVSADSAAGRTMASLLARYLPYLPELANMQMVTDTGALVGQLAPQMDRELGLRSHRQRRQ